MLDTQNYRNNKISVFNSNGEVCASYEGKIYIYFDHKESDGCIHFATEDGKHHRIYGDATVIIDEI